MAWWFVIGKKIDTKDVVSTHMASDQSGKGMLSLSSFRIALTKGEGEGFFPLRSTILQKSRSREGRKREREREREHTLIKNKLTIRYLLCLG